MSQRQEACRVCGALDPRVAGAVEYVSGYASAVFDCDTCGSRFTSHDSEVHDQLHTSGAISYYRDYLDIAADCRRLFDLEDRQSLRRLLSQVSKYRFVIEQIEREPDMAQILEVGCSRGYLTAHFILEGRHISGVDVSADAILAARQSFGDHFDLADSPRIASRGPFDLIYHVGMIGCVADPMGLTRRLLKRLKPGGRLIFNAPNRAALHLNGQMWLDSAPPPDVVTLFPEGFWSRHFSNEAQVVEDIEVVPPAEAVRIGLRRLFRKRWQKPEPKPLAIESKAGHTWSQKPGKNWRTFERACSKAANLSRIGAYVPSRPSDFGLFVQMTVR